MKSTQLFVILVFFIPVVCLFFKTGIYTTYDNVILILFIFRVSLHFNLT